VKSKKILSNDLFVAFSLWIVNAALSLSAMAIVSAQRNRAFAHVMSSWDSGYYRFIIQHGYSRHVPILHGKIQPNPNAFFPLFPFLVRTLDHVLPGTDLVAAIFLNSICAIAATILFAHLAGKFLDTEKTKYATALFALFPMNFIFFWVYSEALCVLLVLVGCTVLLKKHPVFASCVFALASACRPNGLFFAFAPVTYVLYPCVHESIHTKSVNVAHAIKSIVLAGICGLVSISGFIFYTRWIDSYTHVKNTWLRTQHEAWNQSSIPFADVGSYVHHFTKIFSPKMQIAFAAFIVFCVVLLYLRKNLWAISVGGVVIYAGIFVKGWRATRRAIIATSIFVYAAANICLYKFCRSQKFSVDVVALAIPSFVISVLALSNGSTVGSLRFGIIAFPLFIAVAHHLSKKWLQGTIAVSMVLLFILCFLHSWGDSSPFFIGSP
jgi:hypothetical protein